MRIRTVEEIRKKWAQRFDAEDDEKKPKKHSAFSTRLPYGLCNSEGIGTEGMTPREAWEAYEKKTGKSAESVKEEKMGAEKGKSDDGEKYTSGYTSALKDGSTFLVQNSIAHALTYMPVGYTAISNGDAYKKVGENKFELELSSGKKKTVSTSDICSMHDKADGDGAFEVRGEEYSHKKKEQKLDVDERLKPTGDGYDFEDVYGVEDFIHKNVKKLKPLYEEGGWDALEAEYFKTRLADCTKDVHQISMEEADDIMGESISPSVKQAWFREYNHEVKDKLVNQMLSSPETHNAALNIMYKNYRDNCGMKDEKPLSFDEFLVTPITIYRGGTGKEYEKASVFSAYTFDKKVAESFTGSEVGQGHTYDPNGVIYEAKIRPIDTYGCALWSGESEILVPREIAPNKNRD